MPKLTAGELEAYLTQLLGRRLKVLYAGPISAAKEKAEREIKEFGYGEPLLIEAEVEGKPLKLVLSTMRPSSFGHEHFSDRAQRLLWAHHAFNKLPRHAKSLDVGAFTKRGLVSLGDAEEFFQLVEYVEGKEYYHDLERIMASGELTQLDLDRARVLAEYIAEVHSMKGGEPSLYTRRIRELLGSGECIMGLIDNYPKKLGFTSREELKWIELKCVEWRWKLKDRADRLSRVHGDFHPWNIVFRQGLDFTVLDRSRGEWGEPADDITALSINYLFYSLQRYGRLQGPFEQLWHTFLSTYIEKTQDEEVYRFVQPFYAWRALVVASPIWYPKLPREVRRKLFNFIRGVLEVEEFNPREVNKLLE